MSLHASSSADDAARRPVDVPARAARHRLRAAVADLFLPPEARLSDRQRALMASVLAKLIDAIESELRHYIVEALLRSPSPNPPLQALLASDSGIARPLLESALLLRDEELVTAIMRRAEEHRMAGVMRGQDPGGLSGGDVVSDLLGSSDPALARGAMELLLAESRHLDRFQEPLLNQAELPRSLAGGLFWRVSAALREAILRQMPADEPADVDRLIVDAVRRALTALDAGESLTVRSMRLAGRMVELELLDDWQLVKMLGQSRITLFVAALATRSGLDFAGTWEAVTDPDGRGLLVLLRALGIAREPVAGILLALDGMREGLVSHGGSDLDRLLGIFDGLSAAEARASVTFWRLDPAYRRAVAELQDALQGSRRVERRSTLRPA